MSWWQRPSVIVLSAEPFTPVELGRIIRSVPDDHALWRAVLQLIEEEMRDAQTAAEATVTDHGICASEVGGVQHLRRLRDRMVALKMEGRGDGKAFS